ncbi:MAG: AAA family ATPase, partial [Planctomycetota bacterium]
MRLFSMDVDRPGSDESLRLGQLSPGLNAILGPTGSGKSTLLRWLRCIAEENQAANSSTSLTTIGSAPIAGVLHLQNRASNYRVTTDRNGKIRFDLAQDAFDSYPRDYQMRWDGRLDGELSGCDLSPTQRAAFVGLAAAHDQCDTEAALEQLAERLGLDNEFAPSDRREQVFAAQQKLRTQLEQLGPLHSDRDTLLAQQRKLEAELQAISGQSQRLRYDGQETEQLRLDSRLAVLEADLQNTLREIEVLEKQTGEKQRELKLLEVDASAVTVGESYRVQLQKLDDRLHRWRQTLKDLKAHRETIENEATDVRLDKQVGDQLSTSKEPDPRAAMRSLEAQIQSTRRQLDVLVQRYDEIPGYDYRSASSAVAGTGLRPNEVPHAHGVFRDGTGRTFVGHPTYLPDAGMLPETLRSMQKDLHEICQQLSRHEARTTGESLRHQSTQLQRCETELLEAVEQLIEQRGELLRTIAAEQSIPLEQLTLAFGDWCQCSDHPHLMDWLLSEESNQPTQKPGVDPALRQALLDEIAGLKERQKQAKLDSDLCRRQLQETQTHRRGVVAHNATPTQQSTVELQGELQRIATELAKMAERDRLTAELNELTQQLTRTSAASPVTSSAFREVTNRHITGLMAHVATTMPSDGPNPSRYDLVDGFSKSQAVGTNRPVPSEIVRIAMRLAIAELLARKGETISLVIDNALEAIAPDFQSSAVTYLAQVARNQQVVLLTSSQFVAEQVRHHQGWVGNLFGLATRIGGDMNAHLAAVANHEESEKWHRPMVAPADRDSGNRCYLTYAS